MMKAQHNMRYVLQSRGVRLLLGLLSASVLAALVFHVLSQVLSASSRGQAEMTANFTLSAFVGIWMLEAFFVFILAASVGLPIFWLSLRLDVANVFTACGFGLMLGLIVSTFYGGVDIRSPHSVLFVVAVFGIPGLIGGLTFWKVVKSVLKSKSREIGLDFNSSK